MENIKAYISRLKKWFENHPKLLIALSGGVDSCLVTFMARKYLGKSNAIAIISNSASLKEKDLLDARNFAQHYDINLVEVDAKEINDYNYSSNPTNRCYYCKTNLYQSLESLKKSTYPEYQVVNGNNFDDTGDYRPGMQAANEFKVLSPLLECEITKETIRKVSKYFDLNVWNKPASPCLSSRFPYGEKITIEKLQMVEDAENLLNEKGFYNVRVRYRGGGASIEVPQKEIPSLKLLLDKNIQGQFENFGFNQVKIDEEGFVSGKLNREILPE